MRSTLKPFILFVFVLATIDGYTSSFNIKHAPKNLSGLNPTSICFTENKGQVRDQDNMPRKDVLFGGSGGNSVFHLRANGISYQLYQKTTDNTPMAIQHKGKRPEVKNISLTRIDVNWLNSNGNPAIVRGRPAAGLLNFYLTNCGDGILDVKSFEEITYKNVYDGIDVKWYQKNGVLKYDYLVAAGADSKQILLEINGAEKISVNAKGQLVVNTPLGDIVEDAPLVMQDGRTLQSRWRIVSDNKISFDIKGIDPTQPFVIDPAVRLWGTYYGGTGSEDGIETAVDGAGNVYLTGNTTTGTGSIIATTGAHQTTLAGQTDAFLLKLDANGVQQWATYCGETFLEEVYDCATDGAGNVYIAGTTSSPVGMGTSGSHQVNSLGMHDGFLVKFNSSGVRQWATYYGGEKVDAVYGCAVDPSGNIYLSGTTNSFSLSSISTTLSHQPAFGGGVNGGGDAFLVKFNSAGARLWATYYGGTGNEEGFNCSTDALGNVYLLGITTLYTGTAIASAASHQPAYGGGPIDAFLAKFNASGQRQWATYYGGNSYDYGLDCAVDGAGNVYFSGNTTSTDANVISTTGAHQFSYGGGSFEDAFLVKFNSAGVRQWGTYYGGLGTELGNSCALDSWGNVFMGGVVGNTTSSIVATPGSHQPLHGGNFDGYFVKFNSAGVRIWGSFYGGSSADAVRDLTMDASDNLYLCGYAESANSTAIATAASHQTAFAGGTGDAFVAKFYACDAPPAPTDATPLVNLTFCGTNTTTLISSGTGTINWSATPGGSVISSGSVFITPTLNPGSHTFYAAAVTCMTSTPLAIGVKVYPLPVINVISTSTVICKGESVKLMASGAIVYNWDPLGLPGSTVVVAPQVTTSYTVTGTDQYGCKNTSVYNQVVQLCVGLTSEREQTAIDVYPNPNDGVFHVGLNSVSDNLTIKIYNASGQLVFCDELDDPTTTVDSRLKKGIYFYVLSSGNEAVKTGKMVVE